ncbi:hypothetical protein IDJ77_17240 [Mucilaginibacter sp. ZT4R22]|uniref:Uncharacterized protein n=1 Tax=Mucilaginibacter pankratovii TaxID=2772110 RepID=A0ABR7WTC7_9SPHI|nr:hypothetical protein [Mucilaginibacter pankratovii]MBD1365563.1 hypothetical protein [Mucilaginibacter pankratovii]
MNLESYDYRAADNFQDFSFYSVGPKGRIKKTVVYSKIQDSPTIYNLAFGDENPANGEIDDRAITDNDDRDVVLSTVANTINTFCDNYGNHLIYAKGSTPSRTRLYQMSIARLFKEISIDFDVFGIIGEDVYHFQSNVNYDAFLVKRK